MRAQSSADSLELYNPFTHWFEGRRILDNYFSVLGEKYLRQATILKARLQLAQKQRDTSAQIASLLGLGEIYKRASLNTLALSYFFPALSLLEAKKDSIGAAVVSIKIGGAYLVSEMLIKTNYYRKGYLVLRTVENPSLRALGYYAEGIDAATEREGAALFGKALELQKKIVAEAPTDTAALEQLSKYFNATGLVAEALQLAEQIGDDWLSILFRNNLGARYLEQGKPAEALRLFLQSRGQCIAIKNKGLLKNTYNQMYLAYLALGNYQQASFYQQMHFLAYWSIVDENYSLQYADYKAKYESTEKDSLIAELQRSRQSLLRAADFKNIIELTGLVVLLLLLALGLLLYKSRARLSKANAALFRQQQEIVTQKNDLQQLHDDLRASEENLNLAQTAAGIANWVWYREGDRFLFSDNYANILGLPTETLTGDFRAVLVQIIHPDDKRRVLQNFDTDALGSGDAGFEYRIITSSGVRWLRAQYHSMFDAQGIIYKRIGTIQDVTRVKADEEQRVQLAKQQSFTLQLIEAQEKERARLAGELHDGIGQEALLVLSRVQLAQRSGVYDEFTGKQLKQVGDTLSFLLGSIRQLAHRLIPVHLERLGLQPALLDLIDATRETSGMAIHAAIGELSESISPLQQLFVYRIAQELLANTVKHSGATKAEFALTAAHGMVTLRVTDNGRGFNPEQTESSRGFGITNIANRVSILHGTCQIQAAPGSGAIITVSFPLSLGEPDA